MTSPAPQPADGERERWDRPDLDTWQNGVDPPFHYWEDDHTALVHVLWDAKGRGLTLDQFDEVASLIMRSRWFQAARADGARQELTEATEMILREGGRRRAGSIADFLLARKDALRIKEASR